MAEGIRTLEKTPTWAVAAVCLVLVTISILMEHVIHLIGKWLTKNNKKTLYEALEKIKSELMLLGFISLLLTVGKSTITDICISKTLGETWLPCSKKDIEEMDGHHGANGEEIIHRRFLSLFASNVTAPRRVLSAASSGDRCKEQGKVPFLSSDALHELHMFIFSLAVFHVVCSIITLAFGRAKMKEWKTWEMETQTTEYQYTHDPERFRLARDTTFGQRHLSVWSRSPIFIWMVGFTRQLVKSVPKVDYMTLRHGFIMAHLAPNNHANFNFQKYIKRSLEEDFKLVVGISPPIWFLAVLFLLFSTNNCPFSWDKATGDHNQYGIEDSRKRSSSQGYTIGSANRQPLLVQLPATPPLSHPFRPLSECISVGFLCMYEYGPKSCFHKNKADFGIKVSMGYVTLPLYALVTQMGSTMKPTIFNDQVVKALHKWHQNAKKQVKLNCNSNSTTPVSTRPSTPSHQTSTSTSNHSSQRSQFHDALFKPEKPFDSLVSTSSVAVDVNDGSLTIDQYKIDVESAEFSFDKYVEVQMPK
ncbi:hypothetical protein Ccrd_007498 [Cynara cardunculus var. scolymus]|uniref:MLO-like protein n=1 Tax=Cynara cardunculus var. scolymus TaxID=59895 RepID=A0A118JT76_CYNCS|nr:hypothetical protein Ccrd_007498 [Cynara cardunculus var. scolymus]